MTALLSGIWPYILIAGAAIGAAWAALASARRAGRQEQAAKQAEADQRAADTAHRIDTEVDAMKPGNAREELKKWSRD